MGINTVAHSWTMFREWGFGALSLKWYVLIKLFLSRLKCLYRREGRKIVRARGDGGHRKKQCLPDPTEVRHLWTHRDCSSTHKTRTGWSQMGSYTERRKWTWSDPNQEVICSWYLLAKGFIQWNVTGCGWGTLWSTIIPGKYRPCPGVLC